MIVLRNCRPIDVAVAFLVILLILLRRKRLVGQRPKDFPPGPPALPFIGNLHQIPSEKRHLQFQQWAQEYGPVYSLMLGTKVMIVLTSETAIKNLIDQKGAIYSSRPEAYLAQDILSGGLRPLFMKNDNSAAGTVWKMTRKLSQQILNVSTARSYVQYQDLESKAMLLGLLESPVDFIDHLRRYTASLTTQMIFGHRTTSIQDARFKKTFHIFERSAEMIGSRTAAMLDLLPILRKLPDIFLPIVREGKQMHQEELKVFRNLYLEAKQGLRDGTAKPCACVDLVKLQERDGFSDEVAAYISGSLLQAGGETTATILIGFVQAMMIFPEVYNVAQAEIDKVCGDRMPDLNDVPSLPYIRALAKESLRWMPGFFLGIPHAVSQDDTYMDYRIPKGATVILNVWGVHFDPKRHPDPRRFDPMRYMDDMQTSFEAASNPDPLKRDHFSFGAGRRRCQGMHIADRSLFLALARILWAFDLTRAVDPETLLEIVPDKDELVEGVMSLPKPFQANIVPRSSDKAHSVRQAWAEVSTVLDVETLEWKEVPRTLRWADEQTQVTDFE